MSDRDSARATFWTALFMREQTSKKARAIGESLFSLPRTRELRRIDDPLSAAQEQGLLTYYFNVAAEAAAVSAGRASAPAGSFVRQLADWGCRWKLTEAWCFFGILIVRDASNPWLGMTPWTRACDHGFDKHTRDEAKFEAYLQFREVDREADLPLVGRIGSLHGKRVILSDRFGGLLLWTGFCPGGVRWEDHEEHLRVRFNLHLETLKAEHRERVPKEPRRTKKMEYAGWLIRYHLEGETMGDIAAELTSGEVSTVSKGIHTFATLIGLPLADRRGRPKKGAKSSS